MTARTRVELRNEFHSTTCIVVVKADSVSGGVLWLSRRQAHAAWRKLCGIEGCTCGGDAGQRGKQSLPPGAETIGVRRKDE